MTKMGFYTIKELADMFKVSKKTLYNWEKTKKIPKAKRYPMNNYRIYTVKDVEKLKKMIRGS